MKRIKYLLSFTLIIAMVFGMISPITVNAASKKYYWNYSKYVSYDYVDGKWEKNYTDTQSFDKKGRLISSSYKGKYSNSKTKYTYKKNSLSYVRYENGKKTEKTVDSLNSKGNVTKSKTYNAKGKLISTTTYTYDSKGNITKRKTTYKEKGRKAEISTTKYTYKGKYIVKTVGKYSSGGKWVDEYTNKGIIKKSTYTGTDGYKSVYTYNSKGYIKKYTWKSEYGEGESTYSCDKKGNTSKRVDVNTYFNKNYETGEVTKETSSSTTTFKYTYDKNKNIKEGIEYLDGNPVRKYNYSGYKKFKTTSK